MSSIKTNSIVAQSAEKPRKSITSSVHHNTSSSVAYDISQNQFFNQALANSSNLSTAKKTNSQTNLIACKSPVFSNGQQSACAGVGKSMNSAQNSKQMMQQPVINSKDIQSLLQKKMLSQQHRRAESTKLMQSNLTSYSQNVSSSKKGENNFLFQEDEIDDVQYQNKPHQHMHTSPNQTEQTNKQQQLQQQYSTLYKSQNLTQTRQDMQQKYYQSAQKLDETNQNNFQLIVSPALSSRSGNNQTTPVISSQQQLPINSNFQATTSPLQLTPIRDPVDGGRFFLNLAKASAGVGDNYNQGQKSTSIFQTEQTSCSEMPIFQKGISGCKSSQGSPNNNTYNVGDNIVPFSSLIQKNQLLSQQTQQLASPQKQAKMSISESKNSQLATSDTYPNKQSYLPLHAEYSSTNYQMKSANIMSSRSEFSDSENSAHQAVIQSAKQPYSYQHRHQQSSTHVTTTPPKLRQTLSNYNSNQKITTDSQAPIPPPSQEEAKQQFQKILSTLQVSDQQKLLQQIIGLYSSVFHLDQPQPASVQKQDQQKNTVINRNNTNKTQNSNGNPNNNGSIINNNNNNKYQTSNGNDSTSTSSLDDLHGSSVKNKKLKEEKEREEFLRQEEMVYLEQKVFLSNYIDINKDELYKLVREYLQTHPKDSQQKQHLNLKEEKVSLFELLTIQKWIQDKLLERIDEEKKARLKTEEQTSMMLLNQEKTIKVMESKWQQSYDTVRNGSGLGLVTSTNAKIIQGNTPNTNSPVNISDSQ